MSEEFTIGGQKSTLPQQRLEQKMTTTAATISLCPLVPRACRDARQTCENVTYAWLLRDERLTYISNAPQSTKTVM